MGDQEGNEGIRLPGRLSSGDRLQAEWGCYRGCWRIAKSRRNLNSGCTRVHLSTVSPFAEGCGEESTEGIAKPYSLTLAQGV
jgi:hypothetical protein